MYERNKVVGFSLNSDVVLAEFYPTEVINEFLTKNDANLTSDDY